MRAFVATLAVLSTVASIAASPTQVDAAEETCFSVRATGQARNTERATERAVHRLHRYIADQMRNAAGQRIGPIKTNCIRNSCKATTVVCQKP